MCAKMIIEQPWSCGLNRQRRSVPSPLPMPAAMLGPRRRPEGELDALARNGATIDVADPLLQRIATRQVRVGVVGLGYVGLPLVVAFARAGVHAVGVDVDADRTAAILRGESYIADVPGADVRGAVESGVLSATTDYSSLANADTIAICVPTPLRDGRNPDLAFVISAVDQVAARLRAGQLVVLESTTFPGTTDEIVRPRLEASGLRAGIDFGLAFSPERIDPGNPAWKTGNIRKWWAGSMPRRPRRPPRSTASSSIP